MLNSNKRMNEQKHKRPVRSAEATRERLLDAAESLFADKGYHAVSMRDIAGRAKVNLAAAGYHFGSKEKLFLEALVRRVRPLNERRLSTLTALESRKRNPTLPEVLDTFARAMIEEAMRDPESGRRLHRLLSRAFAESDEIVSMIFREELLHVALRFLAAIRRACPKLTAEQAGLGLALFAGCVIHMLRWVVSPPFPEYKGVTDSADVDTLMKQLVAYGTAGFRKLGAPSKNK